MQILERDGKSRRRFLEATLSALGGAVSNRMVATCCPGSEADGAAAGAKPDCVLCGQRPHRISAALGLCAACIRDRPAKARPIVEAAHAKSRRAFGLPETPPRTKGGVVCGLCQAGCVLGEGERGYCGLRRVRRGRLEHLAGTPERGLLQWYRDALPTNCVASWVCSGSRRAGYHNLAVFYESCTFNCLYCQNWHFRKTSPERARTMSAAELASAANERTHCVCFFGGDPSSQMLHALAVGRLLAARGVAVCWETNGSARPGLVDEALELALESGGCVKFDLKAWDESLHRALTGHSNARTLENFARAAKRARERPDPPLVIASTLLVPGYVGAGEVAAIAR
ncbi:MAG: radical SAM protein, partial [Bryobacterales bacterium]|nr:radical SAM protein [Bryobacteraceae bacterium]MDW8131882.1 radical SAM protein [Bryobacterales bacterium]